jgi:hypothetical protein
VGLGHHDPRDRGAHAAEERQRTKVTLGLGDGQHHVVQEGGGSRGAGDGVPLDQLEEQLRVPEFLQDGGGAEGERQASAVQQAGQVGERGGRVNDRPVGQTEPLGQRTQRRDQGVVRVHRPLGLTCGARGEDEQGDVVGVWPSRCQGVGGVPLLPRRGDELLVRQVALVALTVDDHDVLDGRPVLAQTRDHGRVRERAEAARNDHQPRPGQSHHEAHLALAVDGDQRVADRADARHPEVDDDPLDPVRHLERDDIPVVIPSSSRPAAKRSTSVLSWAKVTCRREST